MLRSLAKTASLALRSSSTQACSSIKNVPAGQIRGMAGGQGESVTYAGLTLHKPAPIYTWTAEFMGGLMWFWIFYRFYNDYETFVFGHAQHFERELAAEAANGGEGHEDH